MVVGEWLKVQRRKGLWLWSLLRKGQWFLLWEEIRLDKSFCFLRPSLLKVTNQSFLSSA